MGNGHGGSRPGSGRKRKAQRHEQPILRVESLIVAHLEKSVANLITLADGVPVEDSESDKVYIKPPDRLANEYLINRILGRPLQALEVSGPDGASVPVDLGVLPTNDLRELARIARALAEQ